MAFKICGPQCVHAQPLIQVLLWKKSGEVQGLKHVDLKIGKTLSVSLTYSTEPCKGSFIQLIEKEQVCILKQKDSIQKNCSLIIGGVHMSSNALDFQLLRNDPTWQLVRKSEFDSTTLRNKLYQYSTELRTRFFQESPDTNLTWLTLGFQICAILTTEPKYIVLDF